MVRMRYLGGGFLPGVPARDLSEAESKRFAAVLKASTLYEAVAKEPVAVAEKPAAVIEEPVAVIEEPVAESSAHIGRRGRKVADD